MREEFSEHFFCICNFLLFLIDHYILFAAKIGILSLILHDLEYKSCGILTRTVLSVMVGHVVLALHIVHSLETNRAWSISRQHLFLSEHNLFTLKGKGI